MGSGTTARACAATGRNWLGCDINPAHVAMANTVQTRLEFSEMKLRGTGDDTVQKYLTDI